MIERHDAWANALLQGELGAKRVKTPGVAKFRRPGEPDKPKVETDPARITAWFAQALGT